MQDRLQEIFRLQKELADSMNLDRYPQNMEERVSALATAMLHESVELQRLTPWKWWKKPTRFDVTAAKEELVDILHFLIQAFIEVGMSPDEVLRDYRKKNFVNRERQRSGY
jgi:dimeric dUTPase (all-alpha-NTP-PPase superfamily)